MWATLKTAAYLFVSEPNNILTILRVPKNIYTYIFFPLKRAGAHSTGEVDGAGFIQLGKGKAGGSYCHQQLLVTEETDWLFSRTQWKDKLPWVQAAERESLARKKKKYLPQGSSAALGQAQKGCEVSILGDAPAMTWRGSDQPDLALGPALLWAGSQGTPSELCHEPRSLQNQKIIFMLSADRNQV